MSQLTEILQSLREGPITPLEALDKHGCLRLAARIEELRQAGHQVVTHRITKDGKSFAEYVLTKEKKNGR
jgi:hypothetical protein